MDTPSSSVVHQSKINCINHCIETKIIVPEIIYTIELYIKRKNKTEYIADERNNTWCCCCLPAPHLSIVLVFMPLAAKTIALGAVLTGSMKARLAVRVAGSIRYRGFSDTLRDLFGQDAIFSVCRHVRKKYIKLPPYPHFTIVCLCNLF